MGAAVKPEWGHALAEVSADLLATLKRDPWASQLAIHDVSPLGDGLFHVHFSAPALAKDCRGVQEISIHGDSVRFKPWVDA